MPFQRQCPECGDRMAYIMYQDDGSIEAYCTRFNHRYVLVNIPELTKTILAPDKELEYGSSKESVQGDGTETETITAGEGAVDNSANQYGPSGNPGS